MHTHAHIYSHILTPAHIYMNMHTHMHILVLSFLLFSLTVKMLLGYLHNPGLFTIQLELAVYNPLEIIAQMSLSS